MDKDDKYYINYLQILKEELVPAMGCTEPIAIAYCSAKARDVLLDEPSHVTVEVSGNIIKNVKSVIVPNTGGLKGIKAAVSAGIVAGNTQAVLEVISNVSEDEKLKIREFMENVPINVKPTDSDELLDIIITLYSKENMARVRICNYHTNIVLVERNNEILYENSTGHVTKDYMADKKLLNVEKIYEFANSVDIADVKEILDRQIEYNTAIAAEGLKNDYGANVGSVLLKAYGNDIKNKAKAYAAAGSDARMSGCEMPVIINSGSGNQGMAASIPVIIYAEELKCDAKKLYRALVLSNLITIHQKTGIGRLSAYCGAISAGCGAGCGIAYLRGALYKGITHTLVNSLAIVSGIVCDGAKPSCAAKIAYAVDAGILGYDMYLEKQQFRDGDGIVSKGVENTIKNISRLGSEGMKETDKEIIKIMTEC